jgi:hypothetical protein
LKKNQKYRKHVELESQAIYVGNKIFIRSIHILEDGASGCASGALLNK